MSLAFYGDCNSETVKQSIIAKLQMFGGLPSTEGIEFHCGATTVVKRRKRSSAKTISVRFNASKKVPVQKIKTDPTNELKKLKDEVTNKVAPQMVNKFKAQRDWKFLHKNIQSMTSVQAMGHAQEKCGIEGMVEAKFLQPGRSILDKCGTYFFIIH